MTQKLEALHLEALCEEVSQEPCCYVSSFLPKSSSFILHLYVRACVCLCVSAQDLLQRVQKHSEVEMVDLVLKLKDKLVGANSQSAQS